MEKRVGTSWVGGISDNRRLYSRAEALGASGFTRSSKEGVECSYIHDDLKDAKLGGGALDDEARCRTCGKLAGQHPRKLAGITSN